MEKYKIWLLKMDILNQIKNYVIIINVTYVSIYTNLLWKEELYCIH